MEKIIKILITAGGTREYIDDVRVLTNISTGALGAKIAEEFLKLNFNTPIQERKYLIHYLHAKGSVMPIHSGVHHSINLDYIPIEISGANSLMIEMEKLVPDMDIVIHSMAVSDFGFKPLMQKLKSNDTEGFIESLKSRIIINPKVISYIKKWNPKVKLVSFKFEVGISKTDLINIAYDSLERNDGDYVIANDKKEMQKAKKHIAYIIDANKKYEQCNGKDDIAQKLIKELI